MRPGIQEIIVIIAVVTIVGILTRVLGARRTAAQKEQLSADTSTQPAERIKNRARRFPMRAGIALILLGFILLFAGVGMFRWAFQSYMWSFIIIAVGFLLVFVSRKK